VLRESNSGMFENDKTQIFYRSGRLTTFCFDYELTVSERQVCRVRKEQGTLYHGRRLPNTSNFTFIGFSLINLPML